MMSNSVHVQVQRTEEGWACEVEVGAGDKASRHSVRVTPADLARWGRGEDDDAVADLVRRSFGFILEREPPSSILRRFDLSVIQLYFPEYDR